MIKENTGSLTDRAEILQTTRLIVLQPGQAVEIRAIRCLRSKKSVVPDSFDCLETLAACAAILSSGGAYRNPKTGETTCYRLAESVYLSHTLLSVNAYGTLGFRSRGRFNFHKLQSLFPSDDTAVVTRTCVIPLSLTRSRGTSKIGGAA
jgi:hypothetical protein